MPTSVSGILEVMHRGGGHLRDPARSFAPSSGDPFVPEAIINRYGLVTGASVTGPAQPSKQGPRLEGVETICGLTPEAFRALVPALIDALSEVKPGEVRQVFV